jgi:uncharacterized RDD family membrane protein YckC
MSDVKQSAEADGDLPAGLWRRLAAIAYDYLIVVALLMSLTVVVIFLRGGRAIDAGSLWFQGLLLAVCWLYFAGFWAFRGQTVGMRAWRLSLKRQNGARPAWAEATRRSFAACLSAAALGIGFLWCLVDRDRLCWHDRLSGTWLCFSPGSAQTSNRQDGNRD